MSTRMQELNEMLTKLFNIATGKTNIRNYLWTFLFIVLLFLVLLAAMFIKDIMPYAKMAVDIILSFVKRKPA